MKKTIWQLTLSLSLLLTSFSAMAADTDRPGDKPTQKKQRMHKDRSAKGSLMGLLQDLNLSTAQQAQLKALYGEGRQKHPEMQAFRAQLQTAFVSENFDAAALKQQLQQHSQNDHALQMAGKMLKAWQILTPEQRAKAEARLSQMEEKMAQRAQQFAARAEKKATAQPRQLPRHLAALNLTEAQQAQIKARWAEKKPALPQYREGLKNTKTQILTALKSGQATPESLAALMPAAAMQQGALQMIEHLAALHQILTPAQRQQMVELMQQRQKSWPQRRQGA